MSCLRNPLASMWVRLWEALFATPEQLQHISSVVSRSQALRELEATEERLRVMESGLERQCEALLVDAKDRKMRGDITGARKKLLEKRNVAQQLERLRASQHVISMHLGTMQGAELNHTLMATLKGASKAIQAFAPDRNIREVEDVMFQLETDMKKASEINDALSQPIISLDRIGMDMSSSMHTDSKELERELQLLLEDDVAQQQAGPAIGATPLPMRMPSAHVAPAVAAGSPGMLMQSARGGTVLPSEAPEDVPVAPTMREQGQEGFRVMTALQTNGALADAS